MSGFANMTVVGFLSRDVEVKQVGESTVAKFSIPVDRTKKGEKITDWYNIEAWNNDFAQKYLKKGSNVIVTGTPTLDKAEGGGSYFTLKANNINFTPSIRAKDAQTTESAEEAPF